MNRHGKWLDRGIFILALAGFAINALLLFRRISGGGLAGCGSACEDVLGSRWSQVFGIPVTVFGLLVYAGVLIATRYRRLLAPCLGLLVGAATWFIFVQAAVIGRFCPWCMAAHGMGVSVAVLGFLRHRRDGTFLKTAATFAMAALLGLGVAGFFGPLPVTHRIDNVTGPSASLPAAIHARGNGRKAEFDDGRKVYDVSAMPHLGRTDALRVLVEYFDYSCPACQKMRGYLESLVAKHPDDICVIILPVPLESSCNHSLVAGEAEHPGSCELARLALAVWRSKPDAFAAFHHTLLDGITPPAARAEALALVPPAELDAALRDPWIDELIQASIADWVLFSAKTKHLPKLLITGKRILHGLPSSEDDFIRVMEQELGL
ncbi:MAG: vitamin K epoxide reductase family protein [Luteolibacter sp.]